MGCDDIRGLKVIFEKLEELTEEDCATGLDFDSFDAAELDEIRELRDIVTETLQPQDVYFTRT